MFKKTTRVLTLVLIVVIALGLAGCNLLSKKGKKGTKGEGESGGEEYLILYGKYSNDVMQAGTCWNFTVHEFLGGGIVKRGGKENKNLKMEGHWMGELTSRKYDNYYYISAGNSPLKEYMPGRTMINFNFPDQTLWSADFDKENSKKIELADSSKFPGGALTSSDNKHLAYVLVEKKGETGTTFTAENLYLNASVSDSDLVIRDLKTGKEKTVLKGSYNRQLLKSFAHFSEKEDAFYTILREGGSFKFVKVELPTGRVKDFSEVFPDFDWSKIDWGEFFPGEVGIPAGFKMSPDETKILVYKNTSNPNLKDPCAPSSLHKLWSINIEENSIDVYSEGQGYINGATWKSDSKEFAIIFLTCGGCYPDYIDSEIRKMSRDGKNEVTLVSEPKSKINAFGWSPDMGEIAYSVYGMDFVGWLKSVDPDSKKVKKILSTEDTEGKVNKERPVVFNFVDWVKK